MYQGTYDLACMAEDLIGKIKKQNLFAALTQIKQLNPLQVLFLIYEFEAQGLEKDYLKGLLTYGSAPETINETAKSVLDSIRSENWIAAIALIQRLDHFQVLPLVHRLKTEGLEKNELEYLAIRGAESMNDQETGHGYISATQLD
jgi:hypothetical protein